MQALLKAITFISDAKRATPNANKALLQEMYVDAFRPTRDRSVFVGEGYSFRFSEAWNGGFSNTVLSLSALQKYDDQPFVIVLARPSKVEFFLANSTFLKRISHSSRDLRADNIRGSFNGTDILQFYEKIANAPENFELLFSIHQTFAWQENVERLVEATNAIAARQARFNPSEDERKVLLSAPERALQALSSPGFTELEETLQRRVTSRRSEILAAAKIDNVNLRGEMVERLIVDGIRAHALGDMEATFGSTHLIVDVKTKLLSRASAPKAYNVDKALEFMSKPGSVLAFYMIGIDPEKEFVSARLLPVLEASLLEATTVQHHWAGRGTRGVTQLSGDYHRAASADYSAKIDTQRAKLFIEELLAL